MRTCQRSIRRKAGELLVESGLVNGYWLIRYRLSGLPLKDWRSVAKPRDVGFGRFVHSLAHLFVIDEPTPLRYPSKILELPINY